MATAFVFVFSTASAQTESWNIDVFKTYPAGSTAPVSDLLADHIGKREIRRYQLQAVAVQVKLIPTEREGRIALNS